MKLGVFCSVRVVLPPVNAPCPSGVQEPECQSFKFQSQSDYSIWDLQTRHVTTLTLYILVYPHKNLLGSLDL